MIKILQQPLLVVDSFHPFVLVLLGLEVDDSLLVQLQDISEIGLVLNQNLQGKGRDRMRVKDIHLNLSVSALLDSRGFAGREVHHLQRRSDQRLL